MTASLKETVMFRGWEADVMSELTDGPVAPDAAYVECAAAYTESNLLGALRDAGLGPGDIVFVHVCLDTLGPAPASAAKIAPSARGAMLMRVLRTAVGDSGTLVFPSYTFSFCRQERFDLDRSQTVGGDWSSSADVLEYARRSRGAVRSRDPIHSASAIGPAAAALMKDLPSTCFGEDSLQHRRGAV
jgi:aminoglycoside 3-N-acetyltransferase